MKLEWEVRKIQLGLILDMMTIQRDKVEMADVRLLFEEHGEKLNLIPKFLKEMIEAGRIERTGDEIHMRRKSNV